VDIESRRTTYAIADVIWEGRIKQLIEIATEMWRKYNLELRTAGAVPDE
jgi:hypothetical protein